MRQADSALDAARHEPGSRYRFASIDLTERARARLDLESRLRHALAANELRAFFQPQVETRHGRMIGAEARVRWPEPQRGLVPPNEFIPVAEDSGLIIGLGRQIAAVSTPSASTSSLIAWPRAMMAAQLEGLENLVVDRWQGYFKSRPLPAEEFETLLRGEAP